MERYILGKRIGEGSFGKVYLAQDKQSGNGTVVVKMVKLPANKREQEDCVQEIQLLTELHHPYLVHCKDSFVDDGNLGIVMPFYSGGDLSSVIKKNKQRNTRVPEDIVLEWTAQLMLAAEHLHSKKLLHRDIKADNIFMQTSDRPSSAGAPQKRVSVLLGDFGIARVLEYSNAKARTQCGTPYYMSPELFKGIAYNHKSDIWGLGIVLYELMSLQVPFTATSMAGLAQAVMKTEPKPLPPSYSESLRKLVMGMLEKAPSRRPSAADILRHPLLADKVTRLLEQHAAIESIEADEESGHEDLLFPVHTPAPPKRNPPAANRRRRRFSDPLSRSLGAIPEALSETKRAVEVSSSVSNQRSRIGHPSTAAPSSAAGGAPAGAKGTPPRARRGHLPLIPERHRSPPEAPRTPERPPRGGLPERLPEIPGRAREAPERPREAPARAREAPARAREAPARAREAPARAREAPARLREVPEGRREAPPKRERAREAPARLLEPLAMKPAPPPPRRDGLGRLVHGAPAGAGGKENETPPAVPASRPPPAADGAAADEKLHIPLLKAAADQPALAPHEPLPNRLVKAYQAGPSPPGHSPNKPPVSRRVNDLLAPVQGSPPIGRLPRKRNINGGDPAPANKRKPLHSYIGVRDWR